MRERDAAVTGHPHIEASVRIDEVGPTVWPFINNFSLVLAVARTKGSSKRPFENAVQWLIRRRRMLPRATWFMASETSMRAS
jgi:hypothetical protein